MDVVFDPAGQVATIAETELQWGYKLYGPDYNLIDELNIECIDEA